MCASRFRSLRFAISIRGSRAAFANHGVAVGIGDASSGHTREGLSMARPPFLDHDPVAIAFGTSGMRALVRDLTDLQVYVSVKGAIRYLLNTGDIEPGSAVLLGG